MYCLQVADAAPKKVLIVLSWEKQQCYTPSLHDIIIYHKHVQRPTADLSCDQFEFSLNQSATNKSKELKGVCIISCTYSLYS